MVIVTSMVTLSWKSRPTGLCLMAQYIPPGLCARRCQWAAVKTSKGYSVSRAKEGQSVASLHSGWLLWTEEGVQELFPK